MTWTGKTWKFGETPNDTNMTALQADITAKANGDTGSPQIQNAAIQDLSVDEAALASSAVSQSVLQTTQGEATGTTDGFHTGDWVEMPGGTYGFYPEIKVSAGSVAFHIMESHLASETEDPPTAVFYSNQTYRTMFAINYIGGSITGYARQRYVQSSPPYDLGDGVVHGFIFCRVNRAGEVTGVYAAEDAPWHNSGPTDIRSTRVRKILAGDDFDHSSLKDAADAAMHDLRNSVALTPEQRRAIRDWVSLAPTLESIMETGEVSQAVKNRDMSLLPHPFKPRKDNIVVLLDPLADETADIMRMLQQNDESPAGLLHSGFFKLYDRELSRVSPPGVKTIPYRWK